jgi:hypothetical protein
LSADPYESAQGVLSLRAFRMTKAFSQLLKQQDGFSPEKYAEWRHDHMHTFIRWDALLHHDMRNLLTGAASFYAVFVILCAESIWEEFLPSRHTKGARDCLAAQHVQSPV